MKPTNYTPYHIHTMLSNGVTNIDSITDFHDYVDKAKEYGMKAFGFAEHGSLFAWLKKKEYIESCGMKYIHAVEAYLTEDYEGKPHLYSAVNLVDTAMSGKTVRVKFYNYYKRENEGDWAATINEEGNLNNGKDTLIDIETLKDEGYKKTMDNYHIILIARNYDGVKELNKLVSQSFNRNDYHFYRYPRITFEELFNTSNNIIVTTACLGGVLHSGTPTAKEKMLSFLKKNKERCFLEIQHHIVPDQIGYNQLLYKLSQDFGIRLIAGTDSHSLNAEHTDGRAIMQAAKDVFFADEGDWDLEFKSLDELISVYKIQGSLPMEVIYEAINNTNVMADMVEEFKVDYSPKYPQLYADSEQVFRDKINEGIKKRHIMDKPNYQEYLDRIEYEFEVYKHNGAINFMLLEEDYKAAMRKKNIKYGYSRGSVSGSIIAYLLYITEIDSVKYNLNFERFMNTERVSLADVDTDWLSEDRDEVRKYLYNKAGLYCCDIVTFNTVALKGAIKDVCRGFYNINIRGLIIPTALKSRINKWKESIKGHDARSMDVKMPKDISDQLNDLYNKNATYKEVPYDYLKFAEELIALAEEDIDKAKKKYPKIFKYVDMVDGVVVSVGNHPAGCVVSPFPVDEWFGTFTTSSDPYPVSLLNMKEIDSLNFVKLDILGLDNIGLIYKTCEAAGIPFATPDNIPPDDQAVWDSIRDDTTMIFQWESNSATAYLRQLFSEETIAKIREKNPNASYMDLLSIGNGAIRPAGESYRDKLAQGEYATYGNKALDDFLATTLGWLVYQEQIIEFLHSFCGYTMGEADIVRRGFAKKTGTEKFIPKIKEGFTKTMQEKYGVDAAESDKLIVNFIKVIEDASSYLFSKNHADPYSWIGYICGYLRYYYPLEFITTALNIFEGKEEKSLAIIDYAQKRGIPISPIKFRHSIAKYSFDKETNTIFKGISSIKFMNETVANEMYELRNNEYNDFIELINDLETKTSINSRQMNILIDLDFFEEFGDANKLKKQYEIYQTFFGRKQIYKRDVESMGLTLDMVRPYSNNETEKMFRELNSLGLTKILAQNVQYTPRKLGDVISAQITHLGYITIMDDRYRGMAAVLSVDTKYSPKLKMYSLKNGTTLDCKIDKRTFNKMPLSNGDIVRIMGTKKKPKSRKNADGKWEDVPNTSELWITKYIKTQNL